MYYFAYAATLDEEEMLLRCPDARFVGNGMLENYRFIVNKLGDPTVIRDDSSIVYGVVWNIDKKILKDLDHWEEADNNIYVRETVAISLYTITLDNVLIYIAENNTPGAPRKDYMDIIIAAAMITTITVNHVTKPAIAVTLSLIAPLAVPEMPELVDKLLNTVSPTPTNTAIKTIVKTAGYISPSFILFPAHFKPCANGFYIEFN